MLGGLRPSSKDLRAAGGGFVVFREEGSCLGELSRPLLPGCIVPGGKRDRFLHQGTEWQGPAGGWMDGWMDVALGKAV